MYDIYIINIIERRGGGGRKREGEEGKYFYI
jgi:hypothetical protein